MKTALSVLKEVVEKRGSHIHFECIEQTGPPHQALYRFRCSVLGEAAEATSGSIQKAKQEAARLLLLQLHERGLPVPPPFCRVNAQGEVGGVDAGAGAGAGAGAEAAPGAVSAPVPTALKYVALLYELCQEYSLPSVEYTLVADTGPPHARLFTVSAKIGLRVFSATASTKKMARQNAAQQLYAYLKENLSRVIKDFAEDVALVRAHQRAMDRYEDKLEEMGWRPDLGQRVADYHLGLRKHVGDEKLQEGLSALNALGAESPETALNAVAQALGLSVDWRALPTDTGELIVLELSPTSPSLAFAETDRSSAAASAVDYLRLSLRPVRASAAPAGSGDAEQSL